MTAVLERTQHKQARMPNALNRLNMFKALLNVPALENARTRAKNLSDLLNLLPSDEELGQTRDRHLDRLTLDRRAEIYNEQLAFFTDQAKNIAIENEVQAQARVLYQATLEQERSAWLATDEAQSLIRQQSAELLAGRSALIDQVLDQGVQNISPILTSQELDRVPNGQRRQFAAARIAEFQIVSDQDQAFRRANPTLPTEEIERIRTQAAGRTYDLDEARIQQNAQTATDERLFSEEKLFNY